MFQESLARKHLIQSVFGSDSEEEEDDEGRISGLLIVRGFLGIEDQSQLLSAVEHEFGNVTKDKARNQGMRFYGSGAAPAWFGNLSAQV